MFDVVAKPAHYNQQPIECIKFTENMNFCIGNAFKYVWRHKQKNGVEDLKKSRWYIERQLGITQGAKPPVELPYSEFLNLKNSLSDCDFNKEQHAILRLLWKVQFSNNCVELEEALMLVITEIENNS